MAKHFLLKYYYWPLPIDLAGKNNKSWVYDKFPFMLHFGIIV